LIREATIDDLETVSGLWERMVKEMRPDWTPRRDIWEGMCATLMAQAFYTVLVAEVEGVAVGKEPNGREETRVSGARWEPTTRLEPVAATPFMPRFSA